MVNYYRALNSCKKIKSIKHLVGLLTIHQFCMMRVVCISWAWEESYKSVKLETGEKLDHICWKKREMERQTYSLAEVFVFLRVSPEWGLWRCHSHDCRAICTQDTPLDQALLLLMEVNERGKALWKLFIPNLVWYIPKMFSAPPVKLVLCPNLREFDTHH